MYSIRVKFYYLFSDQPSLFFTEKFLLCVPRNPARLLLDTDLRVDFGYLVVNPFVLVCSTAYLLIRFMICRSPMPCENDDSLIKMILNIEIDHCKRSFCGIGYSELQAKTVAAKLALKHLSKEFTLWVEKRKSEAAYLFSYFFIFSSSKYVCTSVITLITYPLKSFNIFILFIVGMLTCNFLSTKGKVRCIWGKYPARNWFLFAYFHWKSIQILATSEQNSS